MKDKLIISAYGSHNATISMYYKDKYYVVELERWLNSKNIGLCNYMPCHNMQLVYDEIIEWLLSKTDRSHVDVYMEGYINRLYIKPKFKYNETFAVDHHLAHAACTFYQSPYSEALVITFDGGGDNSYFNVYKASRNKDFELIGKYQDDLGFAYMILADYMSDIKRESLTIGNLVYAGKLMGLCSYGKVREEWLPAFEKFYDSFIYSGDSYIGGAETRYSAVTTLMKDIGIDDFDIESTRFDGQLEYDLAATTQKAFEKKFFKHARKYLDLYSDLPVCLAGGCALNVLLNTELAKERAGKIFIPPNTNDCGISVGQLLYYIKPENQVDLTYSGLPIMDENQLGYYLEDRQYTTIENIKLTELATYIANGFIVGFIQGNSEHGARALGNRSILCNPGIKDMKDTLNEKVKHREWYRPFAPLVKLENVHKVFNFAAENSRHMTFIADVKEEWKQKIPAVTHEDGTGRLQTVTRWQNEAIYDLLTEFEKVTDHGVLLNTSFNDNGKPILTRYSDALNLLRNTKLDAVYIHEKRLIVFKNGDEKKFIKSLQEEGISEISLETTVNVLAFAKDENEMQQKFIPTLKKMSRKTERLTVITSQKFSRELNDLFKDQPHVRVYTIDNGKHYYDAMISKRTKDAGFNRDPNIDKTYFFSLFIKPLWIKEVMRDNLFDTKYHVFIDLSLMEDGYNYNIVRDIKTLSNIAKEEDEVIGMTGLKEQNSIFTDDFMQKRFPEFTRELSPLPYIFYGNVDGIVWFSNNYEGMLRWYMEQNKIGSPADYCLVSYAENKHRYKFIELEKIEET